MRKLLLCCSLMALGGCVTGSGSGNGVAPNAVISSLIPTTLPTPGTTGSLPSPFNLYFVTSYNTAVVNAVIASRQFLNSTITYTLQVANHPIYGGAGKVVTSNALLESSLQYALSTGLTGKGQTVAMIDDGVNPSHEQFAGKTVTLSGAQSNDFHGTAVASVAVGAGSNGKMVGFAPGANLFAGYLNYNTSIDWAQLGNYMVQAQQAGAVVMNNSWGLATGTVANTNLVTSYGSDPGWQSYISGVTAFAKTGVIVFAAQNDYTATSIDAMAGLPYYYPALKSNWIAVVNALPKMNGDEVASASILSAPCAEAAQYCIAADGQTVVADSTNPTAYLIGSGASFAAPQVSGSIALLAQAFPMLSAAQLRDRLLVTADNGFFAPDGTVTFASGLTHGYSNTFGMGFLDLKAALLPIGTSSVPVAAGGSIPLGQPAIATGSASGHAVAASLSKAKVVFVDQMAGQFQTSASNLSGTVAPPDPSATRLSKLASPALYADQAQFSAAVASGSAIAMLGHQDVMATPSAAAMMGATVTQVAYTPDSSVSVIQQGGSVSGISVSKDIDLGDGALRIGFSSFSQAGSVLGVTAPGFQNAINSQTQSVSVGFATAVGTNTSFRADGEFGIATGNAAGMISSISPVAYDRLGIALDQADAFQSGDVLTLFARSPIGITSGTAKLDLPVAYSASGPQFASTSASLSPDAREIDVGFEYGVPVAPNQQLRLGVAASFNSGNVAGQTSLTGILGFSVKF